MAAAATVRIEVSESATAPRILFATGGSGGHLYPALAIAEASDDCWPGSAKLFVTTGRPVEHQICRRAGVPHHALPLLALSTAKRRPLQFLASAAKSYGQARDLIREWRPDLIVGTGGWSMTPVVQAASRLKVPIVLCEQNTIPGRATRWLARRATTLCVSFEQTKLHLGTARRIVLTGNPVRRAITETADGSPPSPPRLLVLGGSQGARALNAALLAIAPQLSEPLQGWRVQHQTGGSTLVDELRSAYAAAGIEAEVAPFFDDLPARCRGAQLAVSRAGATTLAELACTAVPALLVPYPHAAADHQLRNAEIFVRAGAAEMTIEAATDEETARRMAPVLRNLLDDPDRRASMSRAMHTLARPDASLRVLDEISRIVSRLQ